MESSLLFFLTVTLMFAGDHCFSQSMSCSTVNGKTICEKQSSAGNTAGAFSSSSFGTNGALQNAAAATGNIFSGLGKSSVASADNHIVRRTEFPNFFPNFNVQLPRMYVPGHLTGAGASDATSYGSNTGTVGFSTSGFHGISNNNGIPGPAFGGYAVADSSGNSYYGGGNVNGGGYGYGYGNMDVKKIFESTGLGAGFPFNVFGRRR
ncbi:uncharacterized protein LOC129966563 isoform X2 [Argiope bruennichi]|nr:uncharacterized protein LOC129966563 isoform X2 [Argiope bruennichi]